MAAEKVVQEEIRWVHSPHTDTAKCILPLYVPVRPEYSARLCLTAHVSRIPTKYGFAITLGSERVAALDVNPGRGHTNFVSGKRETVWETHWQDWPHMELATPDLRVLSHRRWLVEFAARHKIALIGGYKMLSFLGGDQLRLF